MENKNIKVDYHESQVREVISVQVLPNCSAGLDSDNAVVLTDMSAMFGDVIMCLYIALYNT